MRNPLRRKALAASTDVLESVRSGGGNLQIGLGGTNAQIRAAWLRGQSATYGYMYSNTPAVRTVVDYIARNVAQLGLKCYERVGDNERLRAEGHPAAESLAHPDGRTPGDQFIFRMCANYLVYDNAYALKFRSKAGGPTTIVLLPPERVAVSGGAFMPELYRVWRTDGSYFDQPPENIIHWRGFNPSDPLIGLSKLETLRASITEDQVSQATTVELMKNGLKGGHIERPLESPEWSEMARGRFQEGWRNQRASSPRLDPVLEEGMKWVPTAMSPKDAELLDGRRFTVEEIARVYGIPPEVLGLNPTGDLVEARKQVYSDVLPPITDALAGQLTQDLLIAEYLDRDFYFEFDLNEKLRGDPIARFQAITSAVGAPWVTRNEARALENRPPIDGGDEIITPLNVLVGENPKPAPNVMPIQDPNGPDQGGGQNTPKQLEADVRVMLERLYERQRKSFRNRREFDSDRFGRELADDLLAVAPLADRGAILEVTVGMNEALAGALKSGSYERVFDSALRSAPQLARMLVTTLGLDPAGLRELGVPDEIVWERAGFLPAQVDRMRAMQLAAELTDAC